MTTDPPPAARPKRRWFQFSLRTLLVGTALVGVALGVALHWITPAQRQRAAVQMVKRLKGGVVYADTPKIESRAVAKLREWLPQDYFDVLRYVDLSSTAVGNADIGRLAELAQLQALDLSDTQITSVGLAYAAELKQLRILRLGHTPTTDAALMHLAGLTKLEGIDLYNTQITDAGLAHLAGLTELQWLDLSCTHITNASVAHLEQLTQLKWLNISATQITVVGESSLRKALRKCKIVDDGDYWTPKQERPSED